MTGLETVSLVLVAVWLAVLTVVLLLVIRQIALLTIRLDEKVETVDLAGDGLDIGELIPEEVGLAIPRTLAGVSYLILISSTCRSCQELAAQLGDWHLDNARTIALVPGPSNLAEAVVQRLSNDIDSVLDPLAADVAERLGITSTPFAIEVDSGVVTGKAYLSSVQDLQDLVEARQSSDAAEVAAIARGVPSVAN